MRVSYNWLKTYIDFPYSPEELAERLTMAGMEVDGLEYLGEELKEIIVGEIIRIKEHPNADKLVICEVNTGEEVLQIITGAPNVVEGAKVPVAPVGVTLPNGMEIKAAKLRGEPSYGMICSTDELGLSEERAPGIMILEEEAEVGMRMVDYLDLDDYVLKLDLTPNYARCLGLLGLARELKAMQGQGKIKYPAIDLEETGEEINDLIEVEVWDEDLCPRYTGRIIKNVKIEPSPEWLQKRLAAAGIRPINNIVDITNYVMLEYNQPLHAFDYDQIAGKKIIVRRAENNEAIITLDDKERKLDDEVLVIADPDKPIGLAGVMGGANSEITEKTTNIFLESAYFNPVNIRKTAKKLALPSEASHRFERGIDIEKVVEAGNRAAYLMQKYAGGEVVRGTIDVYLQPFEPLEIELEISLVNKILGLDLTVTEVREMLERLEFTVVKQDEDLLLVKVPSYRNDVEREADLIEEVARIYGYNNIPVTRPESKQQGGKTFKQKLEDLTRDLLIGSGLDEVINFSLTGEASFDRLNIPEDSELRQWVRIKNPLSEAYTVLRTSLVPGILEVLANNAKRQIEKMAVFELGKIFINQGEGEPAREVMKLAGGSMGYLRDIWNSGAPDFFYLKGVLESYFNRLGINNIEFKPVKVPYLHPGRAAGIFAGEKELGIIGEVLPGLIEKLDLKQRTAVFELDFELIQQEVKLEKNYQPLPKYPAVERDLAILVDKDVNAGDLLVSIKERGGELLKEVNIFDLYKGDQIPENKKSLAFTLLFQAEDRTLRDEEVNQLFGNILRELEKKYGAKIRG